MEMGVRRSQSPSHAAATGKFKVKRNGGGGESVL